MTSTIAGIRACVFDAYGTLLDVHSAVDKVRTQLGPKADEVSATWRTKQIQYTWLRSQMDAFVPFDEITADALDYAMAQAGITDGKLRDQLLALYMELDCYPEVPAVLAELRDSGFKTAILSNGSPGMLASAVQSAGIGDRLDAVMSVDEVGVYKVDARVYELAPRRFDCKAEEICFMSSNAWDAWAAAHFGFQVVWVNRFGQPPERLPGRPSAEISTLAELPALLR